jgi:hypothetical protein
MADACQKGRLAAKLNASAVKEIRSKYKPYVYTMAMLAEEYQISVPAVGHIISRKTWHWVGR